MYVHFGSSNATLVHAIRTMRRVVYEQIESKSHFSIHGKAAEISVGPSQAV